MIFVHGFSGGGLAWNQARTFLEDNGWPSEILIAKSITEANNVLCGPESAFQAQEVMDWIQETLNAFPQYNKVNLVGHSRGGNNIMRGLWHGYIDPSKVQNVVTLAGTNRNCSYDFPAIPIDETPGSTKYSYYYSDPGDQYVKHSNTYIKEAYGYNFEILTHSEMRFETVVLEAMRQSLLGLKGSNSKD